MPESAQAGARGLAEVLDTGLGEHFQTFESHTPDQTPPNRPKKRYKALKSIAFSLFISAIFCNPKRGNIPKATRTYVGISSIISC